MRSHTLPSPSSHSRAPARAQCEQGSREELRLLVIELALACLEGAALGRSVMLLRDAADDSEARVSDALAAASEPSAGDEATGAALAAIAALARTERAERTAASKWAAHVSQARKLARRALSLVASGQI